MTLELPRRWLSPGTNPDLWGGDGTYVDVAWDRLPPVGPLDGSFSWLATAERPQFGMRFEHQRDPAGALLGVVGESERAGLAVPASFEPFLSDEERFGRIPSCTACYWEVGARLVALPDHDGPERLLRFMNDQQAVLLWYLLLAPGREARVACAWPAWREGTAQGDALEDAADPQGVFVCAESFEEMVKRFWIENSIWFASNAGRPLSGELLAYADAAKQSSFSRRR